MVFDVTPGLENTLDGWARMLSGDKVGKALVAAGPIEN